MIETIILAMLLARIRGNKVGPLFKSWPVYPFMAVEIMHLFFQIQIFLDNYYFIQFAPYLKKAYLFCLIIPIVVYKEYLEAMVGSAAVILGTFLNQFVMAKNGGKMPVFPSLSYITGYVTPGALEMDSGLHVLGGSETKFWFLSDFIDLGYSILSIGDLLIRVFVFLVIFKTIKVLNDMRKDEKIQ